jgi:hypothetical protein
LAGLSGNETCLPYISAEEEKACGGTLKRYYFETVILSFTKNEFAGEA